MNQPDPSLERVLWAAGPEPIRPTWEGLHDQVMGGRSQGTAQPEPSDGIEPASVLFSGHISRENGGGFASLRFGCACQRR